MITNSNWISSPVDIGEVCPIFSKDIKVSKQIKKAELTISATGVYEAIINDSALAILFLRPVLQATKHGCSIRHMMLRICLKMKMF